MVYLIWNLRNPKDQIGEGNVKGDKNRREENYKRLFNT